MFVFIWDETFRKLWMFIAQGLEVNGVHHYLSFAQGFVQTLLPRCVDTGLNSEHRENMEDVHAMPLRCCRDWVVSVRRAHNSTIVKTMDSGRIDSFRRKHHYEYAWSTQKLRTANLLAPIAVVNMSLNDFRFHKELKVHFSRQLWSHAWLRLQQQTFAGSTLKQ